MTIKFLEIASRALAGILAAKDRVDPGDAPAVAGATANRAAGATRCGRPVIAIGSTGTNRATARLLAAIARLDQGAVVLPGLDVSLDDPAWRMIEGDAEKGVDPAASHPQAALHRLLPVLNVTRADVEELGAPGEALAARIALVAEAFRPADATDSWASYVKDLGAGSSTPR